MSMQDVKHVVEISTNIGTGCEHCDYLVGIENFADGINHYISEHGYHVLHVGTQSTPDSEGTTYHTTVALLGTNDPPPPKEPTVFTVNF